MEINARVDYAMRAVLLLAEAQPNTVIGTTIAQSQHLPPSYLHAVLSDLRRAGLVYSLRGSTGGYTLSRPASEITIADVLTALDANLLRVRGVPPTKTEFHGAAEGLQTVWQAAEAAIRKVLENVTLEDIIRDKLPHQVVDLSRTLNPSSSVSAHANAGTMGARGETGRPDTVKEPAVRRSTPPTPSPVRTALDSIRRDQSTSKIADS